LQNINNFSIVKTYEQTFPNKKLKKSKAHEKYKQHFPSKKYKGTFHNI